MERVWAEAFPNGRPNAQHPLLQGVTPDVAAAIYAMGPDAGISALGRLAMTRNVRAPFQIVKLGDGTEVSVRWDAARGDYVLPDGTTLTAAMGGTQPPATGVVPPALQPGNQTPPPPTGPPSFDLTTPPPGFFQPPAFLPPGQPTGQGGMQENIFPGQTVVQPPQANPPPAVPPAGVVPPPTAPPPPTVPPTPFGFGGNVTPLGNRVREEAERRRRLGLAQLASEEEQARVRRLQADRAEREMPRSREEDVASLRTLIDEGRRIASLPGFEGALMLGRMQLNIGANAGQFGYVGGNVLEPVRQTARMVDSQNPSFSAADAIAELQNRLNLAAGRAFLRGQGQVSNFERQMVTDAIGNLGQASNPADFQFRLNSAMRMIEVINGGGRLENAGSFNARPTQAEIAGVINTETNRIDTAALERLASRYNVRPGDMERHVVEVIRRNAGVADAGQPTMWERLRDMVGMGRTPPVLSAEEYRRRTGTGQ
jgi:hypothetical protein